MAPVSPVPSVRRESHHNDRFLRTEHTVFPLTLLAAPTVGMRELFELMSRQHGVASCAQSRRLGLTRAVERRLIRDGTLSSPFPGVLTAGGAPVTFEGRAMASALSSGVVAVSHAAAARLHGLDGFDHTEAVDVIGRKGAHLHPSLGTTLHYTRGCVAEHVTAVGPIPVLTVAATLALPRASGRDRTDRPGAR